MRRRKLKILRAHSGFEVLRVFIGLKCAVSYHLC